MVSYAAACRNEPIDRTGVVTVHSNGPEVLELQLGGGTQSGSRYTLTNSLPVRPLANVPQGTVFRESVPGFEKLLIAVERELNGQMFQP